MINLKDAGGRTVARDIQLSAPAALKRAVLDCFPTAVVAAAGPATVYFGLGKLGLIRAPYERLGAADYFVDAAAAEPVSARSSGPSSVEVLKRAFPAGEDDDFAPCTVSPLFASNYPPPRKPYRPVPMAAPDPGDYAEFLPGLFDRPAAPRAAPKVPASAAGADFADAFALDVWAPVGGRK